MNEKEKFEDGLAHVVEYIKSQGGITDDRFNEEVLLEISWKFVATEDMHKVWTEIIKKKIKKANNINLLIDNI